MIALDGRREDVGARFDLLTNDETPNKDASALDNTEMKPMMAIQRRTTTDCNIIVPCNLCIVDMKLKVGGWVLSSNSAQLKVGIHTIGYDIFNYYFSSQAQCRLVCVCLCPPKINEERNQGASTKTK